MRNIIRQDDRTKSPLLLYILIPPKGMGGKVMDSPAKILDVKGPQGLAFIILLKMVMEMVPIIRSRMPWRDMTIRLMPEHICDALEIPVSMMRRDDMLGLCKHLLYYRFELVRFLFRKEFATGAAYEEDPVKHRTKSYQCERTKENIDHPPQWRITKLEDAGCVTPEIIQANTAYCQSQKMEVDRSVVLSHTGTIDKVVFKG